jgi:signal transduction histidine kinase
MDKPLRVLIIEDSPEDVELLLHELMKGFGQVDYRAVETLEDVQQALLDGEWQIILSDYCLPSFTGLEALRVVKETGRDIPFIILSGQVSEEAAVEAMRAGARDFIVKGRTARLLPAIEREIREAVERKKLRLAQELSEKQRAYYLRMEPLENLSRGMAHQFNTLLTSIIGYTQLLSMNLPPPDPNRPFLDNILTAAKQGTLLTSSILDYGRKPVNHQLLKDLSQLVEQVAPILQQMAGDRVEVRTESVQGEMRVELDAIQMDLALKRLTSNACQAMPEGGVLTFSTRPFSMDDQFVQENGFGRPGEYVMLTVSDTGCGMTPQVKEKAFEPFFTTHNSGSATGLGLALVYSTIKQHDGYITIDSTPGKGTSFRIYLPTPRRESPP